MDAQTPRRGLDLVDLDGMTGAVPIPEDGDAAEARHHGGEQFDALGG